MYSGSGQLLSVCGSCSVPTEEDVDTSELQSYRVSLGLGVGLLDLGVWMHPAVQPWRGQVCRPLGRAGAHSLT